MVMKEMKSFHLKFKNNFKIATNYVTINLLINSISITLLSIMLKTKISCLKGGFIFQKSQRCTSSSQGSSFKKIINESTLSKLNIKTCKFKNKLKNIKSNKKMNPKESV